MRNALLQDVFSVLFPGEDFAPSRHVELADRLRKLADEAEQASTGGLGKPDICPMGEIHAVRADAEASGLVGGDQKKLGKKKKEKRKKKVHKECRSFDYDSYQQHHIALEIFYLGWNYHGFAAQDTTEETVEAKLFWALRRTRCIPEDSDWQSVEYSRCGRTDKGVSALGQVVALRLRSGARVGSPSFTPDEELDYPTILNRALPRDIRVLGWTPVVPTFSARFNATCREYKYFVVKQGDDLDIEAMQRAASYLVGPHDFRHFCKVDAAHVKTFRRTILDFRIEAVPGANLGGCQLFALHVRGTAFLWHQVRCMAAVLLMVGKGQEEPEVVLELLDVEKNSQKPQYNMAPEGPLLFFRGGYRELTFRRTPEGLAHAWKLISRDMLQEQMTRAGLIAAVVEKLQPDVDQLFESRLAVPRVSSHIKLMKRTLGPPLEARFLKHGRTLMFEPSRPSQEELEARVKAI